jgi:Fur family transcriptional regulator, ferric uptake regulator
MRKKSPSRIIEEKVKFEGYLNGAGLKLTSGRQVVFAEVIRAHGHFAAEELVKQCKENKRKVSRATIYRSLRELLAAGVIRETAFGEKHQHFEHVYDEKLHHHARCIRCYEVIEFPCFKHDTKYKRLLKRQGFYILGHEMHFYGICKNCENNGI